MSKRKLSVQERIASIENIKGNDGVKSVELAGYSHPRHENHRVGKQLMNKIANPLSKRTELLERAALLVEDILGKDQPNVTPTWNERLKAADIAIKLNNLDQDKKGDVYNTLIVQDIKGMSEQDLLANLSRLREQNKQEDTGQ